MTRKVISVLLIGLLLCLSGCALIELAGETTVDVMWKDVAGSGELGEIGNVEFEASFPFEPSINATEFNLKIFKATIRYETNEAIIEVENSQGVKIDWLKISNRDSVRVGNGPAKFLNGTEFYETTLNQTNVHSRPSLSSGVKFNLILGEPVLVVSAKNGWYTVMAGVDKTGFVRAADNGIAPLRVINTRYKNGNAPKGNYALCIACNGAGILTKNITCQLCGGTGGAICKCRFKKNNCYTCGGTGYKKCIYCFGGGINCTGCQGRGYIFCRQCLGKGCSACGGRGTFTCAQCHGQKKITCAYCKGTGKMECLICLKPANGSCNVCNGSGKISCTACHASGKINVEYLCSKCRGIGEINTATVAPPEVDKPDYNHRGPHGEIIYNTPQGAKYYYNSLGQKKYIAQ